jgi:hypothetical protein
MVNVGLEVQEITFWRLREAGYMKSRRVFWVGMLGVMGGLFVMGMLFNKRPVTGADGTETEYIQYFPCVCRYATPTPEGEPPGLPDLFPYWYTVRYYGCPWGSPGNISVHVQNIGAAEAGHFVVEINRLRTTVDALKAGSSQDAVVEFQAGPVGGVDAKVDVDNEVQESQEGNNYFSITFTPPPPCVNSGP